MPVQVSYPGVYIEEIPSGVRTITGVATSIAAFIDFFFRGPMNEAVQIFNIGDFEREFGGLDTRSEASYAIQQFFLNGGAEAWVVRVASGTSVAAAAEIDDTLPAAVAALTVRAISEGSWGNRLRIRVNLSEISVAGEFNLVISETATVGGRTVVVRQEIFRNLSMLGVQTNFIEKAINDPNTGSKLVRVTAAIGANAPVVNGTLTSAHANPDNVPLVSAAPAVSVQIGGAPVATATFALPLPNAPLALVTLASLLEAAIRSAAPANSAFANASVTVQGPRLHILSGPGEPSDRVVFSATGTDANTVNDLLLAGAVVNSQEYVLGAGLVAGTAQLAGAVGDDGDPPDASALIGNLVSKTGIFALENVDLFNLLCIPRAVDLPDPDATAVLTVAETYCEKRRAFFLIDTPVGRDEPQKIKNWLNDNSTLRHRNAGLYYPRVKVPNPLDNFRLRSVGASGTLAGLFARTDSSRGVWKAPAGTEATLRNIVELDDILTDPENGTLNPLGINCLRNFPVYGNICWGARTLDGADQQASEWKYIPVRRLALFLEETLYRALKWVVFEPNDEPLWSQIRLNVGAFMHDMFRKGAFQGQAPREAYFVKCDKETTTQNDINLGIVNIVVGFAPLKPAEFVIIKIQQMAGQIQT